MSKHLPALCTLLMLSGCAATDPCNGVAGTCIALRVEGPNAASVDRLDISAAGTTLSSTSKGTGLPVQVGIVPPSTASGSVDIDVTGYLLGTLTGSGSTTATIVAGGHTKATVVLATVGGGGGDMGDDMAMNTFDLSGGCTPDSTVCGSGSTLQTCSSDGTMLTPTSCPLGCGDTPTPHCKGFVPSAPAMATDLQTGLADTVMTTGTTYLINTDDGSISNIRAAGSGTLAQIVFRTTAPGTNDPGAGVFAFNSLEIQEGATLQAVGGRALVIVTNTTLKVTGVLDARGYNPASAGTKLCNTAGAPGPGGFAGATATSTKGSGLGGGGAGTSLSSNSGGGAGAGHGALGGAGGTGLSSGGNGGPSGVIDFPPSLLPFRGGSGGGSGTGGVSYSFGGGGGGAVQLVAGTSITVGGGTATAGGVDVGGCGGGFGIMSSSGGGGGAGGTILIEAPAVSLLDKGVLAANGGGGGSYNNAAPMSGTGFPGDLNAMYATGGPGGGGYEPAGYGAAAAIVNGAPSNYVANSAGGGGGGSVGIILINNVSGSLTPASGAIVSPTLNAMNGATPPQKVSAIGTIGVQ